MHYSLIDRTADAAQLDADAELLAEEAGIMSIGFIEKPPLFGIRTEHGDLVAVLWGSRACDGPEADCDVAVRPAFQAAGLGSILMLTYAIEHGDRPWVVNIRDPERMARLIADWGLVADPDAGDGRTYRRGPASDAEREHWAERRSELAAAAGIALR